MLIITVITTTLHSQQALVTQFPPQGCLQCQEAYSLFITINIGFSNNNDRICALCVSARMRMRLFLVAWVKSQFNKLFFLL